MPAFFSSYRAPRELHQEASAFPAEIVRHILSFAEPASLAACCATSYALLEIASANLYDHVEIVGLERLRRLFCERRFWSSPRINTLLSLRRIRSLTFIAETYSLPAHSFSFPHLSTHRRGPTPLALDTLTVRVLHRPDLRPVLAPDIPFESTLDRLFLHHFNPLFFHFVPITPPQGFAVTTFVALGSGQQEWTRLRGVRLVQSTIGLVGPNFADWTISARSKGWWISFEFPVPFDVHGGPMVELMMVVRTYLARWHGPTASDARERSFGRVEIVVETEGEAGAVRGFIEHEAKWEGMEDKEVEKVMESDELVVVVKDPTKTYPPPPVRALDALPLAAPSVTRRTTRALTIPMICLIFFGGLDYVRTHTSPAFFDDLMGKIAALAIILVIATSLHCLGIIVF